MRLTCRQICGGFFLKLVFDMGGPTPQWVVLGLQAEQAMGASCQQHFPMTSALLLTSKPLPWLPSQRNGVGNISQTNPFFPESLMVSYHCNINLTMTDPTPLTLEGSVLAGQYFWYCA